ncbi:MAG: HAD hydrolase-like protein [Paracoccaceae bacterium]
MTPEMAIPGVAARIARLLDRGKRVLVVTNAAGYPSHADGALRRAWLSFRRGRVISSRATCLAAIAGRDLGCLGVVAPGGSGLSGLAGRDLVELADDPGSYVRADNILFLGSGDWTEARQALLVTALRDRPRPVLVANPDIVATRETGFSIEPGSYAHRLADDTGVVPEFFGKPFANIYDLSFQRLGPGTDRTRVLMVGDSLHTDILGAQAARTGSALVTSHGFFGGFAPAPWVRKSGIRPDYVLDHP